MSKNTYLLKHIPPTVEAFIALRATIGWGETDITMVKASLESSLFHVTAYHHKGHTEPDVFIGMGRVVGDGAMYFYIQDVVVDPNYQKQGVGELIMNEIETYLVKVAKKGATIGLLSAKGKENFYRRFDYQCRPSDNLGNGMCKFVI